MLINFTPDRKKKFGKTQSYPSLVIDNNVMEYSYVKSNTVVSVYAHINDITQYRYDENSKLFELAGKFSVSCRNIRTGNETLKDFRDKQRILSFQYKFNDLEKFLNLTDAKHFDTTSDKMETLDL